MIKKCLIRAILSMLQIILWLPGNGQKIGINNPNPTGLLSLATTGGRKISFWGDANGPHYGMASKDFAFQIFSDASFTNIVFGTGSSSSFTEFMRINTNNQVGLGTTSPQFNLDIMGRLRLSSYMLPEFDNVTQTTKYFYKPAGIYFNNTGNTATLASIGINNGNFGFYRSSDNRMLFGFNPSGSMMINGSTGTEGQVLMSNEFTAPPTWENDVVADMYSNLHLGWGASLVQPLNIGDAGVLTFTTEKPLFGYEPPLVVGVNSNTKVLVKFDLIGSAVCCGYAQFQVSVRDNGVIKRNFRYSITADQVSTISGAALLSLTAGAHSIDLQITRLSGPRFQFSPDYTNQIFSMITVTRINGKTF